MCQVQDYFDTLEMKKAAPPKVISSAQIEGEKVRGGRSRFAFETDFQLSAAKRLLGENWRRLPERLSAAKRIDLEVQWSDRGALRRVVTNEDAKLYLDDEKEEFALPYHVCLSEFLFGAPLYHQRRDALGLAPLPLPSSMIVKGNADAGAPGVGPGDAGVAPPHTDGGAGHDGAARQTTVK